MKSRNLRAPLILFLTLFLAAGALALGEASTSSFGSDMEDRDVDDDLRSGFGDDIYDEGQSEESTTSSSESTDSSTQSTDSENEETTGISSEDFGGDIDDEGTSRDGFGDDIDDETGEEETEETEDTEVTSEDFGEDIDDEGTSRDGFGDDTDDEGSPRDGFGDDTDDEGSPRDGFGDDVDDESPGDGPEDEPADEEQDETEENEEESESAADAIDPELSSSVWPGTVNIGETVTVTGNVVGVEDEELTVMTNTGIVSTEQVDGQQTFQTTFTPEETGTHEVEVVVGELSETHDIEVQSTVDIESITWPSSVEEGESFQVCAEVSSEEDPEVRLLKDGAQVEVKTGDGTKCFTTQLHQVGDHQLTVEAEVDGDSDTETTTVNAYTVATGTEPQNNQGMIGSFMDSMSANLGLVIAAILAVALAGYVYSSSRSRSKT